MARGWNNLALATRGFCDAPTGERALAARNATIRKCSSSPSSSQILPAVPTPRTAFAAQGATSSGRSAPRTMTARWNSASVFLTAIRRCTRIFADIGNTSAGRRATRRRRREIFPSSKSKLARRTAGSLPTCRCCAGKLPGIERAPANLRRVALVKTKCRQLTRIADGTPQRPGGTHICAATRNVARASRPCERRSSRKTFGYPGFVCGCISNTGGTPMSRNARDRYLRKRGIRLPIRSGVQRDGNDSPQAPGSITAADDSVCWKGNVGAPLAAGTGGVGPDSAQGT